MNSMYHDSSVLPGGLTVIEAAKALLVLDLFALRATVNALFMELVAADPFGAQTETAADAAQMIGQAAAWTSSACTSPSPTGAHGEPMRDLRAGTGRSPAGESWPMNSSASPGGWTEPASAMRPCPYASPPRPRGTSQKADLQPGKPKRGRHASTSARDGSPRADEAGHRQTEKQGKEHD